MKILFYSDVHLRDRSSFLPWNQISSNGFTKELNNILYGLYWLSSQIQTLKPDIVFNLGDTYHNPEYLTASIITATKVAFSEIKSSCDKVGAEHIILSGNHDCYSNYCSTAFALSSYGIVLTNPQSIDTIYAIPWSDSYEKVTEELEKAKNHKLIVCHLDFQGSLYDNGRFSTSPISPQLSTDCISGHIHTASTVGSVNYVGSLVQHVFYADNIDRVGGILLWDNGKITRFSNLCSKHYVKITDESVYRLKDLNPENVVIKFVTKSKNIPPILQNFEHMCIEELQTVVPTFEIQETILTNPEKMLIEYLEKNNIEALSYAKELL